MILNNPWKLSQKLLFPQISPLCTSPSTSFVNLNLSFDALKNIMRCYDKNHHVCLDSSVTKKIWIRPKIITDGSDQYKRCRVLSLKYDKEIYILLLASRFKQKKKALYLLYFYFSNPGGQGSTLQYLCVPVYKYIYLMFFFKYCPILCILMSYCLNLTHTYHHFFVHFLHSINICNLL